MRKPESLGYHVALLVWRSVQPFDTIRECDRQRDGQEPDSFIARRTHNAYI